MNGKKAKRLRREAGFTPDAEAKDFRFKFPGLAKSVRVPVFKRNADTGNVITNKQGQPLHYEFETVHDEDTNAPITRIRTEVLPIQKAVSLEQSGRPEKATYRKLKKGKPHGQDNREGTVGSAQRIVEQSDEQRPGVDDQQPEPGPVCGDGAGSE